jgi:hypothetical protein
LAERPWFPRPASFGVADGLTEAEGLAEADAPALAFFLCLAPGDADPDGDSVVTAAGGGEKVANS